MALAELDATEQLDRSIVAAKHSDEIRLLLKIGRTPPGTLHPGWVGGWLSVGPIPRPPPGRGGLKRSLNAMLDLYLVLAAEAAVRDRVAAAVWALAATESDARWALAELEGSERTAVAAAAAGDMVRLVRGGVCFQGAVANVTTLYRRELVRRPRPRKP